jgi:sugar/nucleoside kinase (ribokinase family)
MASAPVVKYRLGAVTASVWANERHYNVTLAKSYKDGEEWKETDSLGAGDLMNAVRVLKRCEDYIADQH